MDRREIPLNPRYDFMTMPIPALLTPAPIQFWTVLGNDQPRLIEVDGRECISRPYCFTLKLRSEAFLPLNLDELIGTNAHFRVHLPDSNPLSALIPSPEYRDFCGVLSHVSHDGNDDNFSYYSATLRPRLWTLGLNRKYRFFSQKTTREIVGAVLPEDFPVRWRLSSEYEASDACYRNYCVQYGESDLSFICRLLEEDGMFYYFEHQYDDQPTDLAQHSERLVITDHIEPVAESQVPAYQFDPDTGGNRDATRITKWQEVRTVVSNAVDSLDRHFQRPKTLIKAVQQIQEGTDSSASRGNSNDNPGLTANSADETMPESDDAVSAIVTHYPSGTGRRYDAIAPGGGCDLSELEKLDQAAQRDAKVKAQRLALRRVVFNGRGNVASLMPGAVFRVFKQTISNTDSYYISSLRHRIRLATSVRSGSAESKLIYRNSFRCYSSTLPYRAPKQTRKPSVKGVVPATVVSDLSSPEDQVCVDQYGRVKVSFPWQVDDKAPSCWIRVNQVWAGPRWGAYFWPRVGHEVLVAFEYGDPDRPIIVGSVYNADNMPPLTLPEHKLSCGIHSCSHNGNPLLNTNVVVFHDKSGAEYLQLHSETHLSVSSETKSITKAAGDSITFRGHHWMFDPSGNGSGGGGSDATGDNDAAQSNHKGSDSNGVLEFVKDLVFDFNHADVEYAVGDSYSKTFGRNFETYFGCNIWLGCDPVEIFEWAAAKSASPIPSLLVAGLFGAAGQGTTTFGGTHDIQYGKNVSVHRGAKIEKRCQSVIGTVSTEKKGNETAIDVPARCVCESAVVVLLLIEFIVMLLTRVANNHDTKDWNGFLKFGDFWSRYLLPRFQGLIEAAETTLGTLDVATAEADGTLEQSVDALKRSFRAMVTTDGVAGVSLSATMNEVEVAADALRNCIKRLKESIFAMAKLV